MYSNRCLPVIFGNVYLFQNTGTLLQPPISTVRPPGHGAPYRLGGSPFSSVLFSTNRSAHPTSSMSVFFLTRILHRLNAGSHQIVQQIPQKISSTSRILYNGQLQLLKMQHSRTRGFGFKSSKAAIPTPMYRSFSLSYTIFDLYT